MLRDAADPSARLEPFSSSNSRIGASVKRRTNGFGSRFNCRRERLLDDVSISFNTSFGPEHKEDRW